MSHHEQVDIIVAIGVKPFKLKISPSRPPYPQCPEAEDRDSRGPDGRSLVGQNLTYLDTSLCVALSLTYDMSSCDAKI